MQKIVVAEPMHFRSPLEWREKFEYRKFDQWWKRWPTALAVWWLKRARCHALDMSETTIFHPKSTDDLKAALYDHVASICDWRDLQSRDFVLVIGRKQYMELIEDRNVMHELSFKTEIEVRWGRYQGETFGIDTLVLPYMDGFIAVPRGRVVDEKPNG